VGLEERRICASCQHGPFTGFRIRCAVTGELLTPTTNGCEKWRDKETKVNRDEESDGPRDL